MRSRRLLIGGAIAVLLVLAGLAAAHGAQQHALDTEATHVANQLRDEPCLDDWGANEGAATKSAGITGLAPTGLRVSVSLPYAYRVDHDGEPVFADTASEAVYAVTLFGTRRVSGDEIDPC